ncbi:MAG: serpin family protein [Actinomycetia bacterium]|nr:serpin family protein [Actinomycetes bacterium]
MCRSSVAIVVVLALLAVACGSDSAGGSGATGSMAEPSSDLGRAAVDPDAPVVELVNGFGDAGFELMRTQPEDANLVFSPLSIGHALLMARGAADDETQSAIDEAFAIPAGMAAHDAWNSFDAVLVASNGTATALDDSESPIVAVADRLWPSSTAAPDQVWVDLMATHHGAGVETIDVTDGQASRQRINGWVSEQTNELVPELLPEGFITPQTVLVLTDAVYFKAQWRTTFGKYGPIDGTFTRLDGSTVDTSFMVDLEQPGPRGTGDGFVGAEVPYLGDDYTMLLVIPDEGRFSEIRDRLSVELLAEIDASFTTGPYELRMPQWETTTAINFIGWLTDLGIAPGGFPGIGPGVSLDGAVHGADITVDETGTEAAAATALGFDDSGPPDPELLVEANRPFFYLIRHIDTGAILFAGQVTDPTNS